jgi:hypothetical protein
LEDIEDTASIGTIPRDRVLPPWEKWRVDLTSVPQQDNDLDCGVFMCSFVEAFLDGEDRVRLTGACRLQ